MNEIQKIFLSAYMILIHTLSGNCIAIVDKETPSISHKDSGIQHIHMWKQADIPQESHYFSHLAVL